MLGLLLFFISLAYAQPEQQSVLHQPAEIGVLRRFQSIHVDLSHVFNVAQNDHLDIWQITPDHIDIYFPPYASSPSQLQLYPHTSSQIPVTPPSLPFSSAPDANWTSLPPSTSPFHTAYHPLFEIESFLYQLEKEHPHLVSIVRVGISGEGREVLGVEISRQVDGKKKKKKNKKNKNKITKGKRKKMGFVITGAQHAREWIATATSLYLTHALVTSTNSSTRSLSTLLDAFDFYIIPSPNPDGYDYTWESDRFWYKNRMKTGPVSKCVGVDMNRNWGYKWKPTVSFANISSQATNDESMKKYDIPDHHPCSQWYPGNRPFQAPEVNHIALYIETLPNLKAFVDLRSYGQMLSSPFSYSCKKLPQDAENQLEAALGAVSALRKPYETEFLTGTLCSLFYRAYGNIVDWMYKQVGIKYSYAAHLRDTGTYGFALPPHLIKPVGEETAKMIEYLANFIARIEK